MKTLLLLLLPIMLYAQVPCKRSIAFPTYEGMPTDTIFADTIHLYGDIDNGIFSAKVFIFHPGSSATNSLFLSGGCTIDMAIEDTSKFKLTPDPTIEGFDPWDFTNEYFIGGVIASHPVEKWFQTDTYSNGRYGWARGNSFFPASAKHYCWWGYKATAWVDNILYVSNIIPIECVGPPPNPRP